MTVIASWNDGTSIWMGADSQSTGGYDVDIYGRSKIFTVGKMLIGTSGSIRISQILEYHLVPPELTDSTHDDPDRYIVGLVIPAIRNVLREHGNLFMDKDVEGANFNALIAYDGQVYGVEHDLHVGVSVYPYNAIGSGRHLAMGAMFALHSLNQHSNGEEAVTLALRAACEHHCAARSPFVIKRQTTVSTTEQKPG